jgi:hypothetical protein
MATTLLLPVQNEVKSPSNANKYSLTRHFSSANYREFERLLLSEDWNELFRPCPSQVKWTSMLQIFKFHFNNAFPLVRSK